MIIPDYICSLPEMKSLMVSSVDGLTLTYRFALKGQENQALYFSREIHKFRVATKVIFPVCLPNGWLLLLRHINFVGVRKAGPSACAHCFSWVCRAVYLLVRQCMCRLCSVSSAVPWLRWPFNFSSLEQTNSTF